MFGPPDLSDVVESFSFPIVIRDYAPSSTVAGGLIAAGATVDTPTTGHAFPAKGGDIERLRSQSPGSVLELHTASKDLRIAVKGSQARGSVLVFQSKTYEVRGLGEWFAGSDGQSGYQQAWVQEVTRS